VGEEVQELVEMAYSLGNAGIWSYYNDMGNIQEERPPKSADLDVQAGNYSDSDETDVVDNGGCTQKINVTFIKIVSSWSEAGTFVRSLLGLINGDQSLPNYPLLYVSDILGSIYVKIEDIDPVIVFTDGPVKIQYTLRMIQCNRLS